MIQFEVLELLFLGLGVGELLLSLSRRERGSGVPEPHHLSLFLKFIFWGVI